MLACGALALHVKAIAARNGLELDVHPLPPELHNRPERIAPRWRRWRPSCTAATTAS